jgi:hypothetical protein
LMPDKEPIDLPNGKYIRNKKYIIEGETWVYMMGCFGVDIEKSTFVGLSLLLIWIHNDGWMSNTGG